MLTIDKRLEIKCKNFMTIINHLAANNGRSRLVGGVVRDSLLGISYSDVDIATDLKPYQVMEILTSKGIKVIPTGIRFGTVTAIIQDELFEVTTLREDIRCNGRYAIVKYSTDFFKDAARRDFTINALSYCPIKCRVYDYFGGFEDLKNQKVVFIGNADDRVREDYLRILRFFRFSSRYSAQIDSSGLNVCIRSKNELMNLSRERIKSEIDAILLNVRSPQILQCMFNNGILTQVLPVSNYSIDLHLHALLICSQFQFNPSLVLIYGVILIYTKKISISILMELKFSKIDSNTIINMHRIVTLVDKQDIIYFLRNIWLKEKNFIQYFVFAATITKDNKYIYDEYLYLKQKKKVLVFPVTGYDLLDLGYKRQEVGEVLKFLRSIWIKNNFVNQKLFLLNTALENKNIDKLKK